MPLINTPGSGRCFRVPGVRKKEDILTTQHVCHITGSVNAEPSCFHSWTWVREDFRDAFRWLLEHPDFDAEQLWKTRSKSVYKAVCPPELYSGSVAVKSYYEQRFLRYFLRGSLARREAEGYLRVQNLGIPTAEVLAYGERRSVWWLSSSFMITRFVEDTRNGSYFCRTCDGPGYGTPDMMVFCLKLMEMLAQLHRNGCCHGGTHPRNFLWLGSGKEMRIVWIDLATVKSCPDPSLLAEKAAADLKAFFQPLGLSAEQKLEALRKYEACNPAYSGATFENSFL